MKIINCAFCKNEFESIRKSHIYCNRKCRDSIFEKKCLHCGDKFHIPRYKLNTANYCSHKCTINAIAIINKSDRRERFLSKVSSIYDENGCLNWIAKSQHKGYGIFHWSKTPKKIQMSASRAAYLLFVGNIPEGLQVCHTCDNRKCVNILHLWLGTTQQNTRDMNLKGRGDPRGKKKRLALIIWESA